MAKIPMAQMPAKLYDLLAQLSAEERGRVIQATMMLFGDETQSGPGIPDARIPGGSPAARRTGGAGLPSDPGAYFDEKAPQNKGEALAVAARYRELTLKEVTHTKAELREVITAARRNFDSNNFGRDINNAKRQAGFFNLGTGRDTSKLSYYGQQFIDALPDRDAAARLQKPRVRNARKKKSKANKKGA